MSTHEEQVERRRARAAAAKRAVSPDSTKTGTKAKNRDLARLEAQAVRDMAISRARTLEGLDYAAQKPDTYRIGGRREDTRPRRKVKTQRAAATPVGTRDRSQRVARALGRKPNAMTWRQWHAIAQRAPWTLTSKLDGPDRKLTPAEVSRLKSAHDQLASSKLTPDGYLEAVRRIIDVPARDAFHNTGRPAALESRAGRELLLGKIGHGDLDPDAVLAHVKKKKRNKA